ncbi:MAG: hypothetical protein ABEI78_02340 [Candidatus Nanohaloarchaea archaeon]
MVDGSISKGWQEMQEILKKGRVDEEEEAILFHMAQSGDQPSYQELTKQTTLDDYRKQYEEKY